MLELHSQEKRLQIHNNTHFKLIIYTDTLLHDSNTELKGIENNETVVFC